MNHIDDRWDPKIEIYEVPYVIENHNVVFRATKELLDPLVIVIFYSYKYVPAIFSTFEHWASFFVIRMIVQEQCVFMKRSSAHNNSTYDNNNVIRMSCDMIVQSLEIWDMNPRTRMIS